jgi:hypothetical protein
MIRLSTRRWNRWPTAVNMLLDGRCRSHLRLPPDPRGNVRRLNNHDRGHAAAPEQKTPGRVSTRAACIGLRIADTDKVRRLDARCRLAFAAPL